VASWTNATAPDVAATASRKGILRPARTVAEVGLTRDYPVAPELQPFVERYWSVRWDRSGLPGFRSEVLSHPTVNLSVETGEHPRFGFDLPAVLVHGAVTRRFVIDLEGSGRVTAAKFRPGGFVALTGLLPRSDTVRTASDVLDPTHLDPATVLTAVLSEDADDARAAALDRALQPLAQKPTTDYLELLDLLGSMLRDRGLVRVDQVAALADRTVRSLQRLFAAYLGIAPKAVLARYRLHDVVDALEAGEQDLAGLASSLGWFDQAHFSRDFRRAVGVPPTAYLRSIARVG
jgi:AraC-like DNA-binding protein